MQNDWRRRPAGGKTDIFCRSQKQNSKAISIGYASPGTHLKEFAGKNNTNSVFEFVLFPYGAEKRMFCGCALKASAAEGGCGGERGDEAPCCLARPPENTGFLISSQRNKKARTRRAFAGAEKRIRTSGRVTPVTRFPIVLLKPLRHLCRNNSYFTTNLPKMQLLFMRFCHFSRTNSEFIPMAESAF